MSAIDESGAPPIGYGNPPAATRFKKGHTGNRKGRPRGSENITKVAARLFDTKVPVRIGDKVIQLPFLLALTRSLKAGAMQGDSKAMRALSELMEAVGYYDEKPEQELPGMLVISGLHPNEDEWLWGRARDHYRAEMKRRTTEAEQKSGK